MLVNMGMISFAAVLQFAPRMLGGIFWRRGNEAGALLGLGGGFLIWFYTLLLPAFIKSGWISDTILKTGPWESAFLIPNAFRNIRRGSAHPHFFWSMVLIWGFMSRVPRVPTEQTKNRAQQKTSSAPYHRSLASACSEGIRYDSRGHKEQIIRERCSTQYFVQNRSGRFTEKCAEAVGLAGKDRISITELAEFHKEVEKLLPAPLGLRLRISLWLKQGYSRTGRPGTFPMSYAGHPSDLRVSPAELKQRIDYYQDEMRFLRSMPPKSRPVGRLLSALWKKAMRA